MHDIAVSNASIPAMTTEAIAKVARLEADAMTRPQLPIETHHALHGGQYARTVRLPAGSVVTGALIKVPTTLIVSGDCTVYIGDESVRLMGYNVLVASAGRKQAFIAHEDTYLTMTFPTNAKTVEQAEEQFTDEAHKLLSRSGIGENIFLITGE